VFSEDKVSVSPVMKAFYSQGCNCVTSHTIFHVLALTFLPYKIISIGRVYRLKSNMIIILNQRLFSKNDTLINLFDMYYLSNRVPIQYASIK